jgi:oxalate---CoA ligase
MLEKTFHAPVIEAYAMTETCHQITCNFLPPGIRKAGSVGKGRGVELMIMGEDGNLAKAMVPGQVLVRGENVFNGKIYKICIYDINLRIF